MSLSDCVRLMVTYSCVPWDGEADDMLQMNCTNCHVLIKSDLLAEVQVIECPDCKELVGVENVVISTKTFSFSLRSALKDLLLAARDRFQRNKAHNFDVQTNYEISKRLAKLLKRDDFRLSISYASYVQINFDDNKRLARLLNISSTGAAIEFAERGLLPDNNSETNLQLLLPGHAESLSFPARVVWSRKEAKDETSQGIAMGLQFREIDEKTRACLWDFITNSETSVHT